MADYDLVIIGGSLAGRYAAIKAVQTKKVALIEPDETTLFNLLFPYALSQLRQVKQQFFIPPNYQISLSWAEVSQWIENVITNIEEKHSLTVLAALGVDVIVGNAEFSSQKLLIKVNSRKLSAHSYLIATGSTISKAGLETHNYFTPANIRQQLDVTKAGKNWVVIGGNPDSITWTQVLNRLGFNVTLIVKSLQVLSSLDADTSYLVQAILEADGVRVLTDTSVSQVKEIEGKKWIQAGNEAIETDEILTCVGYEPNIKNLQLEAVNVKWHRRGIEVNSQLQTTNPQIYACGDVIGGYSGANISNYEAKIAVNNALSLPKLKVNYQSIPWGTYTSPQIAQVGFTENKAIQIYEKDVVVLPYYFKDVAAAQLKEETTGIFKIVMRRNGEILGATIIGSQAAELINIMALAIAQKLKIEAISHLFPLYPSFAEIFTFGR